MHRNGNDISAFVFVERRCLGPAHSLIWCVCLNSEVLFAFDSVRSRDLTPVHCPTKHNANAVVLTLHDQTVRLYYLCLLEFEADIRVRYNMRS